MPRDVLTLDVEINPTQIVQQTDLAREMIAQNLSVGGSQFGVGGPIMGSGGPIMGGPYGGISPYAPAFAPESIPATAFQTVFPGAFAPPGITPDMYSAALGQNLETRVSQFGVDSVIGLAQFGTELAGGTLGGAAGAALGYKYGGTPGAILGGIGGAALGGSVAGEFADLIGTPIGTGAEGLTSVSSLFQQYGFRAGMGSFLQGRGEEEGSQSGLEIAQALAKRSIEVVRNDVEVQSLGLDAQQVTKQLLTKGFQNNLFGFQAEEFGQGDDKELQDSFIEEKLKPEFRRMKDISKAFNTTYDEALDIRSDLRRLGAIDDADIEGQIGILGSSMREFGLPAKELFRASAAQGSAIARGAGLSGAFGMQQAEVNTFRLAEAERAGFLDTETKLAGGGLPNLAANFSALEDQQLGKGGYIRDLIQASTTSEGGLDSGRLKELIAQGLTPLQAREAANKAVFSGGDAFKNQEDFNYNFRDLADQARREVPGFEQAGISQEIMAAAKQAASITGRPVTEATIASAAQRFGLDENSARAFAQSQGNFPKSADVMGLMDRTRDQFEDAEKDRENDLGAIVRRRLGASTRNLQSFGEDVQMGFTSAIEEARARYTRAIGKKEDGSEATEREKEKALQEYEAEYGKAAKNVASKLSERPKETTTTTGKGATAALSGLGESLVEKVGELVSRVTSILSEIQGSKSGPPPGGNNTTTSATSSETSDSATGSKK